MLILACLINILFTLLGRIISINIEDMLGFYISFIAVIINVIIFCYLTKSTWSFLPFVYFIWFLGTLWSYLYFITYQVLSELDDGNDVFGSKAKDWLRNVKKAALKVLFYASSFVVLRIFCFKRKFNFV